MKFVKCGEFRTNWLLEKTRLDETHENLAIRDIRKMQPCVHERSTVHIASHVTAHIRRHGKAHIRSHIDAHIRSHIKAHIPSHSTAHIRKDQ